MSPYKAAKALRDARKELRQLKAAHAQLEEIRRGQARNLREGQLAIDALTHKAKRYRAVIDSALVALRCVRLAHPDDVREACELFIGAILASQEAVDRYVRDATQNEVAQAIERMKAKP